MPLPDSMQWTNIDMTDDNMLQEVINFLKLYYLADAKGKFKLDYTPEFLKWAIGNTGFMLAITTKKNNSICGLIGTTVRELVVFDKTEKIGVVDFLCAHPVFREKKIAHVLIDEATRRAVKQGVNVGCFTTEKCIPSPITRLRYYHRPINYLNLQKTGFTDVGGNPENIQKKFEVKKEIPRGYFELTDNNIEDIYKLYKNYM